MKPLRFPEFPELGTRRAVLLAELLIGGVLNLRTDQFALEIYDLVSKAWPIEETYIGLGQVEIRLGLERLPIRTRNLAKAFIDQHRRRMGTLAASPTTREGRLNL